MLRAIALLGLLAGLGSSCTEEDPGRPLPGTTAGWSAGSPASPADPSSSGLEAAPAEETRPTVVFIGTSLTAGYGLREDEAFPALIQARIDERGLDYRVVNAGVSGDTSAGGLRRLDWLLRLPVAVLVLELGANDMLRGQDPASLEDNLDAILGRTAESHPGARFLVAGMRAAPNLGRDYGRRFDRVYPALAERHRAAYIPFLLDGIAGVRRLNQADGIHPTAEGHRLIAERVWEALLPILD
jgi:acyl-CoA thioesterase-1